MSGSLLSDQRWLQTVAEAQPRVAELLRGSPEQQRQGGYFHTLREISQQPTTWVKSAEQMISSSEQLVGLLAGSETVVLTGSGSSEFAGDCVCAPLRRELGIVVEVVGGGALLAHGSDALPPRRPGVVVSLGRSGDSPESVAAVARLLRSDPTIQHLVLTCNRQGGLALNFRDHPKVHVIALDEATNDRSLVMTSSFTNLTLAARFLGLLKAPADYRILCKKLSDVADHLLQTYFGSFATVAGCGFDRVVFLGSGSRLGAARESALKVLEMTAGRVPTLCDSYLAFRHGPMSFVHENTLIVCFLSSDAVLRAYECDSLRELDQKNLGRLKVIVGEDVPRDVIREEDMVVQCPGLSQISDDDTPVIHVLVGQLLAFFRCLEEGLHPDSPSKDGVINRVVPGFKLHLSPVNERNNS
jgi:tagatose-6-phosphate ketose/aldose isomerase